MPQPPSLDPKRYLAGTTREALALAQPLSGSVRQAVVRDKVFHLVKLNKSSLFWIFNAMPCRAQAAALQALDRLSRFGVECTGIGRENPPNDQRRAADNSGRLKAVNMRTTDSIVTPPPPRTT